MEENVNQTNKNSAKSKSGPMAEQAFFIPDLCNVQALLFLVLVAELLAIVLALADGGVQYFDWSAFALTSLFVQWVFLLSAALLCQLRPHLSNWPVPWSAGLCYLLLLMVVAATNIASQYLLNGALSGIDNWTLDLWQTLTHVLICAVLAGIALRYFYLTQQLRMRQRAELMARIQALQSRIRPHFLFNSMNIIASLIPVDQDAAETAVEDLASLFRASLAEVETEVSLADELDVCRRYARIEQLRLGDRLRLDWQVNTVPPTLKIPSLSLQPLLENAIYHGIQQLPEGGVVTIKAEYQQGVLRVEVANPVLNDSGVNTEGNRLAQNNINHRLQALYGPKAGLSSYLLQHQYVAVLSYPVNENA
ncbi:MAG: histidine kinase [Spongiibacteraceae bacterium]